MLRDGFRRGSAARWGVLGVLAVALVPGVGAQAAAPTIFCVRAFGHAVPTAPCDPNPNQFAEREPEGKVYPTSYLYYSSFGRPGLIQGGGFPAPPRGSIFVEGNATPGATILVTVTDGVRTLGPFSTQTHVASPEGPRAGDFRAEIMVSELGDHRATPEVDADDMGDNELGPTRLTVLATPTLGSIAGGTRQVSITKHAAVPGDVAVPSVTNEKWPPYDWERNCIIAKANEARLYVQGDQGRPPLGGYQPVRTSPPGVNPNPPQPQFRSECAVWPIGGRIEDELFSPLIASEISDVRITITKGVRTYLDVKASDVPGILTRDASNYASYNYLVSAWDYPPNPLARIGRDDSYTITVTICDAWGNIDDPDANCNVLARSDVIVYPF